VVEPVLVRRGFWRNSDGTASACAGIGCLVQGLVKLMACSTEAACLAEQYESQVSESEELPETEESSEVCDEASDHPKPDEADAEVAREEL
jgi:hypothetical protein